MAIDTRDRMVFYRRLPSNRICEAAARCGSGNQSCHGDHVASSFFDRQQQFGVAGHFLHALHHHLHRLNRLNAG